MKNTWLLLIAVAAVCLAFAKPAPQLSACAADHQVRGVLVGDLLLEAAEKLEAGEFESRDDLHKWIYGRTQAASQTAFASYDSAVEEMNAGEFDRIKTANFFRVYVGAATSGQ